MSEFVPSLLMIPVFQGLTPLELEAVADLLTKRSVKAKTVLFNEGDSGSELYFVLTGTVKAKMQVPQGGFRTLEIYNAGDLFGEMSIIEGEPHSSTCVAEADCDLLVLSGLDFFRLTWDHPVLGTKILSNLSRITVQRLSQASSFLDDLMRWGTTARKRTVTDDLTGVFNRRFLEEALRMRFQGPLPQTTSMLLLDLDNFRDINAIFGPEAGDAVIANVAASMQSLVRRSDIPARLAGDEFAILLPDTGIDEAVRLAETIRRTVAELFLEFRLGPNDKPKQLRVTVSIGVTTCPPGAQSSEEFMGAADLALYAAKEGGRNRVAAKGFP